MCRSSSIVFLCCELCDLYFSDMSLFFCVFLNLIFVWVICISCYECIISKVVVYEYIHVGSKFAVISNLLQIKLISYLSNFVTTKWLNNLNPQGYEVCKQYVCVLLKLFSYQEHFQLNRRIFWVTGVSQTKPSSRSQDGRLAAVITCTLRPNGFGF